jgi:hypothetical protein
MSRKSLTISEELSLTPQIQLQAPVNRSEPNKLANATLQSLSDDLREAIATTDWLAVQTVADRLQTLADLVQQKAIERGKSKDDFQKMLERA